MNTFTCAMATDTRPPWPAYRTRLRCARHSSNALVARLIFCGDFDASCSNRKRQVGRNILGLLSEDDEVQMLKTLCISLYVLDLFRIVSSFSFALLSLKQLETGSPGASHT